MKFAWILGIIIVSQQIPVSDNLLIKQNKEPIIRINRSDFSLPIQDFPLIDSDKFQLLSKQLDKQIRQPAIDAVLDEHGNIIPEKAGREMNKMSFTKQFYAFFYRNGPSTIDIPFRTVYPRVDSELLSTIRTQLLGHYVTYFNSGNKERSHNVALAAEAINNHVVFPGETFSFNQTVGIRTQEKGYLPAPIIVKGELSEGIGGGICQVSSTLFNAADRSGLQILKRYSHSRRVPYVPPGRDATVSWYGPDLTFKNIYNQPVLIRAKAKSGTMVVTMFSSDAVNVQQRQIPSTSYQLPLETYATGNVH